MKKTMKLKTTARLVAVLITLTAGPLLAQNSLKILPEQIKLTGTEARQRLLIQNIIDGRVGSQVHADILFESSNPAIVKVENGFAIPVGNGKASITAVANGKKATVSVTVEKQEVPHRWGFRNHVQPILTKTGCNMGACHGAASGKNGFKLSLRGYDQLADFKTITRQSRGRRIVPSDPGRSLLLTKPTGLIPHKGGIRFYDDSLEYRVIAEWIADGQTPPKENDPRLERLEVLPGQALLKPEDKQQLSVIAHFTDGRTEEVTQWTRFTSTNLSVAEVNKSGIVQVTGYGEGSIVAGYLATNVISGVTVPYSKSASATEIFAKAERNNLIDDIILKKLASLNIPPSQTCTDSEFLRRAYLDTIGILPTAEEARRFLTESSPDKRVKLVDYLLTHPSYIDYWTYKWSDLLLVSGARLRPKALDSYYQWIRTQVSENTPWDQFVRKIVTSKGSTFENGAANFFSLHQDPLDMAETVSMAFLGMSINCARCHDHPLEKWTNDEYYGMASLLSRVRGKGWGGDFRRGDGNRVIFDVSEGEIIQPRTGKPQKPKPLDGVALDFDSTKNRREHLADWLTSRENPYFSRAIVNRIWANYFGKGIVDKVDDLRLTNPPSNPELIDSLAQHLADNKFDVKSLIRLILTSKAYQYSSQAVAGNEGDERFYSRFYPRRLKAEVLLDAFSQTTGAPTIFPKPEGSTGKEKEKNYSAGTRALQLPDANIAQDFLQTFGRPERIITCECERSDEPSMVQVLNLVNGNTLNSKLKATGNFLEQQLKANLSDAQLVENAYLSAVSRFPSENEKSEIAKIFFETPAQEKRQLLEDLYWGLISSKEFLFNH